MFYNNDMYVTNRLKQREMKISEVKEKVLKGELVIENDMPKSEKTIKVLNYIVIAFWGGAGLRYGLSNGCFSDLLKNELTDILHIKVSQIDLEEEFKFKNNNKELCSLDANGIFNVYFQGNLITDKIRVHHPQRTEYKDIDPVSFFSKEVTYTSEQAEQLIKDWNEFHNMVLLQDGLSLEDREFLNHKFNTEEKTLEELKAYYEEKEGKKVIIKSK